MSSGGVGLSGNLVSSPSGCETQRSGEIYKASSGLITRWQPRLFTLTNSGKFSYTHGSNDTPVLIPQDSNSIARVVLKPSASAPGPVFTLHIGAVKNVSKDHVTGQRELSQACKTREERDTWVQALNSVIRDTFPLSFDSPLILEDAPCHVLNKSSYVLVKEPGSNKWVKYWCAVNSIACCMYTDEKAVSPSLVCSFTTSTSCNAEAQAMCPGKFVFSISSQEDDGNNHSRLFLFAANSLAEQESWLDAIQKAQRSQEERQLFDLAKDKGIHMSKSNTTNIHPKAQEKMLESALAGPGSQYNTIQGISELNSLTIHKKRPPKNTNNNNNINQTIDNGLLNAMKSSLEGQQDYSQTFVASRDIRAPSVDQSKAMTRHTVLYGEDLPSNVQLTMSGKSKFTNPQLLSDVHALTISGNSATRMPLGARSKTYNASSEFPTLTTHQRSIMGSTEQFVIYHSQPSSELEKIPPVSVEDQRYTHSQVCASFGSIYIGKISKYSASLQKQRLYAAISGIYIYFFTQKSHTSPHAYAAGIRPTHCAILKGCRVSITDLTILVYPATPLKSTSPGVIPCESVIALTLETSEDCNIWYKHITKISDCYNNTHSVNTHNNRQDDNTYISYKAEESKLHLADLFSDGIDDSNNNNNETHQKEDTMKEVTTSTVNPSFLLDPLESASTAGQSTTTTNQELQQGKNDLSEQIRKLLETSTSNNPSNNPMLPYSTSNQSMNIPLTTSNLQEHGLLLPPMHPHTSNNNSDGPHLITSQSTLSHEMLEQQLLLLQQQQNLQQMQLNSKNPQFMPLLSSPMANANANIGIASNTMLSPMQPIPPIQPITQITPLNMMLPLYNQQSQLNTMNMPQNTTLPPNAVLPTNAIHLNPIILPTTIMTPTNSFPSNSFRTNSMNSVGSISSTQQPTLLQVEHTSSHQYADPQSRVNVPAANSPSGPALAQDGTPSISSHHLSGKLSLNLKELAGIVTEPVAVVPDSWSQTNKPLDPVLGGLNIQFELEEAPLFDAEQHKTAYKHNQSLSTSLKVAPSHHSTTSNISNNNTNTSTLRIAAACDVSDSESSMTSPVPKETDLWDHLENPKTLQILVAEQSTVVAERLRNTSSTTGVVDPVNSFESYVLYGKKRTLVYICVGPSTHRGGYTLRIYSKKPAATGARVGNSVLPLNFKEKATYALQGVSFALHLSSEAYGCILTFLSGEEVILGFSSAFLRNTLFKALTEASTAISFVEYARSDLETESQVITLSCYAYLLTPQDTWQRVYLVHQTKPPALVAYASHIDYEANPREAITHVWLDQSMLELIPTETFGLPYVFKVQMSENTVYVRFTNSRIYRKWADSLIHVY